MRWVAGQQPGPLLRPWDGKTAHPVLLIGNTSDPATPYQDSVAMSRLLGRARLLTVEGFGHTETLNPSTCAEDYENRYLLTGALPPAGTVCPQNGQPFPASQRRYGDAPMTQTRTRP